MMNGRNILTPELQKYTELRVYFSDLYRFLRAKNKRFSQKSFAKMIGISPIILKKFLEGDQTLPKDSLISAGKHLGWTAELMSYAVTLKLMDQGDTKILRDQIVSRVKAHKEILMVTQSA